MPSGKTIRARSSLVSILCHRIAMKKQARGTRKKLDQSSEIKDQSRKPKLRLAADARRRTQTKEGNLIEFKTVETLRKIHEAQILNYLKATGFKLGLLVNFYHEQADIKRYVNGI